MFKTRFLLRKLWGVLGILVKKFKCRAFDTGLCWEGKECIYKHEPRGLCYYYYTYGYCKKMYKGCKFKHYVESYDREFETERYEIYWSFKKPVKAMVCKYYGDFWTCDGRMFYGSGSDLCYEKKVLHWMDVKRKKPHDSYWHDGHHLIQQFEKRTRIFELLYYFVKDMPIDILYIIVDEFLAEIRTFETKHKTRFRGT